MKPRRDCHWHVPEAHYLESWSDVARLRRHGDDSPAVDRSALCRQIGARTSRRGRWQSRFVRLRYRPRILDKTKSRGDFERFWRKALHDGVVADSAFAAKTVALKSISADAPSKGAETRAPADAPGALEIFFQPDPTLYDGRFANNGWLQELPKPLTKITWDNAVLVSPATAQRFGLGHRVAGRGGEHGNVSADMVELQYAGRTMTAPVWVAPGHADGCATVYFGYGRTRAGKVGTGTGFNAYAIRTSAAVWQGTGLELRKTGAAHALACTQFHHSMEGRELVRAATLEEYRREPHFAAGKEHGSESAGSLYAPHPYEGYAWGMTIDTNACIGCNACVVACQAENNIPVVGKTEVTHGREMHWIRIDRYYKGGPSTVPRPSINQCRACSARTRPANWCVRSMPPTTAAKGSTIWFTTAASARAIAQTIALTKCAALISFSMLISPRQA